MKKIVLFMLIFGYFLSCAPKNERRIIPLDSAVSIMDINCKFIQVAKHEYMANYSCYSDEVFPEKTIDSILELVLFVEGTHDTVWFYKTGYESQNLFYAKSWRTYTDGVHGWDLLYFNLTDTLLSEVNKAYGDYSFGDKLPDGQLSETSSEHIGACKYTVRASAYEEYGIYRVSLESESSSFNDVVTGFLLGNLYDILKAKYGEPAKTFSVEEYEIPEGRIRFAFIWELYGDKVIQLGISRDNYSNFSAVCWIESNDIIKKHNKNVSELQKQVLEIIKKEQRKAVDKF